MISDKSICTTFKLHLIGYKIGMHSNGNLWSSINCSHKMSIPNIETQITHFTIFETCSVISSVPPLLFAEKFQSFIVFMLCLKICFHSSFSIITSLEKFKRPNFFKSHLLIHCWQKIVKQKILKKLKLTKKLMPLFNIQMNNKGSSLKS